MPTLPEDPQFTARSVGQSAPRAPSLIEQASRSGLDVLQAVGERQKTLAEQAREYAEERDKALRSRIENMRDRDEAQELELRKIFVKREIAADQEAWYNDPNRVLDVEEWTQHIDTKVAEVIGGLAFEDNKHKLLAAVGDTINTSITQMAGRIAKRDAEEENRNANLMFEGLKDLIGKQQTVEQMQDFFKSGNIDSALNLMRGYLEAESISIEDYNRYEKGLREAAEDRWLEVQVQDLFTLYEGDITKVMGVAETLRDLASNSETNTEEAEKHLELADAIETRYRAHVKLAEEDLQRNIEPKKEVAQARYQAAVASGDEAGAKQHMHEWQSLLGEAVDVGAMSPAEAAKADFERREEGSVGILVLLMHEIHNSNNPMLQESFEAWLSNPTMTDAEKFGLPSIAFTPEMKRKAKGLFRRDINGIFEDSKDKDIKNTDAHEDLGTTSRLTDEIGITDDSQNFIRGFMTDKDGKYRNAFDKGYDKADQEIQQEGPITLGVDMLNNAIEQEFDLKTSMGETPEKPRFHDRHLDFRKKEEETEDQYVDRVRVLLTEAKERAGAVTQHLQTTLPNLARLDMDHADANMINQDIANGMEHQKLSTSEAEELFAALKDTDADRVATILHEIQSMTFGRQFKNYLRSTDSREGNVYYGAMVMSAGSPSVSAAMIRGVSNRKHFDNPSAVDDGIIAAINSDADLMKQLRQMEVSGAGQDRARDMILAVAYDRMYGGTDGSSHLMTYQTGSSSSVFKPYAKDAIRAVMGPQMEAGIGWVQMPSGAAPEDEDEFSRVASMAADPEFLSIYLAEKAIDPSRANSLAWVIGNSQWVSVDGNTYRFHQEVSNSDGMETLSKDPHPFMLDFGAFRNVVHLSPLQQMQLTEQTLTSEKDRWRALEKQLRSVQLEQLANQIKWYGFYQQYPRWYQEEIQEMLYTGGALKGQAEQIKQKMEKLRGEISVESTEGPVSDAVPDSHPLKHAAKGLKISIKALMDALADIAVDLE